MRKMFVVLAVIMIVIMSLLSGCGVEKQKTEKVRDLEFTVLSEEKIPEDCLQMVWEKKAEPFKFTYEDGEYMYVCVGYGEQKTSGYSISINDLYLTENAIYVNTNLIGPKTEDKTEQTETYPYAVLKTEYMDKNVVFE